MSSKANRKALFKLKNSISNTISTSTALFSLITILIFAFTILEHTDFKAILTSAAKKCGQSLNLAKMTLYFGDIISLFNTETNSISTIYNSTSIAILLKDKYSQLKALYANTNTNELEFFEPQDNLNYMLSDGLSKIKIYNCHQLYQQYILDIEQCIYSFDGISYPIDQKMIVFNGIHATLDQSYALMKRSFEVLAFTRMSINIFTHRRLAKCICIHTLYASFN